MHSTVLLWWLNVTEVYTLNIQFYNSVGSWLWYIVLFSFVCHTMLYNVLFSILPLIFWVRHCMWKCTTHFLKNFWSLWWLWKFWKWIILNIHCCWELYQHTNTKWSGVSMKCTKINGKVCTFLDTHITGGEVKDFRYLSSTVIQG
jgi:hypothetical protein